MSASSLETVLVCRDLGANVAFLVDRLGARIESISPADDPQEYVVRAADAMLRLRRGQVDVPARLVLRDATVSGTSLTAPNGTIIELRGSSDDRPIPEAVPSFSLVRAGDDFGVGRAEMHYRDLLPDRWGGRFIASHILIPDGGDVADYVHFHRIRFQMIFCAVGWVDVVYEDQGEPFRLEAGDCVIQPPEIRHRVLRSAPGLEVIEIGCPAVHDTLVEHEIALPTVTTDPERRFSGQRFVRHVATTAERASYAVDGLRYRDTGIGSATEGLAGAIVVESAGVPPRHVSPTWLTHDGEFMFVVLLRGSVDLDIDVGAGAGTGPEHHRVAARDALAFPAGSRWSWSSWTDDFEFLQVSLPAGALLR